MKIQCDRHTAGRWWLPVVVLVVIVTIASGCSGEQTAEVPYESAWGIYELDLESEIVRLVYTSTTEIQASALRLHPGGGLLAFSAISPDTGKLDIYTIGTDGKNLVRLTASSFDDIYPVWSPDGMKIAFLSLREIDLDIFMMDASGSNERLFHDSGYHDADIDWSGETIAFTSQFAVWLIRDDGTGPVMLTDPPERGKWGEANLPAGDYDPRFSPDGRRIVFERLEDTAEPNGGYNLFLINTDGTGETRLTETSYAQGLANWSHAGDRIVYSVAAIDGAGRYDIWMINTDGTDNRDITPGYFPDGFLCHSPVFSADDASLYFIGQWWE